MLVYRKKKIRSSAFPSFPHTFTGAHSQVCGFPLCLCWLALVLTVLAQASCSQGFLRMDSSSVENGGPSSEDHWLNIYNLDRYASKLPDTPLSVSLGRELFPSLSPFLQEFVESVE